jgi:hypothetical protein
MGVVDEERVFVCVTDFALVCYAVGGELHQL